MRALVISGAGLASVEEVEEPAAGAGHVVVDVLRAGICGTDVELFTGTLAYFGQGKTRFPVRPGHEWCGVVSAVGAGVDPGWLGVRVTGDTMLGCGRCPRCRAGRGHVCAERREVGILGWAGALAEQVLVPASSLHRLPDGIDDRAGALVEPGGNAWRAASAAQAGPGKRVLVCGPGTIGLLTVAFARAAGAEADVLALDRGRAELAGKLGASGYWTFDDLPPGGYDAVVDCTDDQRMPALALGLAEPTGRVVFIGISGVPSMIDSRDLVLGDLTAVGILGASAGLAPAIEHYADGRVAAADLVGVTVGLDRAAEALAGRVSSGAGTKIQVDPRRLGAGMSVPGGTLSTVQTTGTVQTTAPEVVATFAVTPQARDLLERWRTDTARPQVPRVVLRHATRVLYQLEPSWIEKTCKATEHPLGDISKTVATAVRPVVDWRPDFAFTHVMHLAMEALGTVPTFGDFTRFCAEDAVGRAALGDPARRAAEDARRQGYPAGPVAQAVRWRVGLAYYSFVREMYTIAVLRAAGLDVRAHPLADALFRVDAWTDRTVLSLYIRNSAFRDGARGRKPRTVSILAGATPPFRFRELRLDTRHEFGCVHLPGAGQVAALARSLRSPARA